MIKSKLLHPVILHALAGAGHGAQVLIADGNYPFSTRANPAAELVYLNLMPGLVTVTQALEAVLSAVPVEAAQVMLRDDGEEPEIYADFRRLLPDLELRQVERFAFYERADEPAVMLVIATGEQRLYANIILTIGVVRPSAAS